MYNIIIYLYQLGVIIYSLFNEKVSKMWHGEREAIRVLREKVDPKARYVWFHAASLGEFEQGRPLMEQMKREHPDIKILLTFFSPSGYEVRKNYEGADIICYLPLDTIGNARRFLRAVRPEMAFFIKYEFWYNYLHILKHRNVPVYSVSSIFREDQVFFRWYGRQYGRVLKCFTHFYVQNELSKTLLAKIGLTNVTVTGDTRFDRVLQIKEQAKVLPIVESFTNTNKTHEPNESHKAHEAHEANKPHWPQKVFIAGSSWQPDEEIFTKYFNEHRDWKLIIAPHVIGEDHLQQIEKMLEGRKIIRYTEAPSVQLAPLDPLVPLAPSPLADAEVLIINCFGLLSSIYHYADVTYVGGGFGVGIHNTLEAAVWDVPVIFGPNNQKFQEAQGLKACKGGFEITCYEDFEKLMNRFDSDSSALEEAGRQAGAYVKSLSGATKLILSDVTL